MSNATTTPSQSPPLRVLVVEDNQISQKLVTALLERRGHVATVADNGREAVRIVDTQPFDLILMDVQMPEMDGLEATRVIRRREEKTGMHIPIVALTAGSDRQSCRAAGMDEFIPKPIRAVELAAAIERVAALRRLDERSPAGEVQRVLRIEDSQGFTQLADYVARAVQQELLPKDSPDMPGLDIFGRCEPAENIGGDYFDYIPMMDGRLAMVIGDVSGRGIRSAFLMAALRAVLRSLASVHRDVGVVVTCTNRVLADDLRDDESVSLMYACYDPRVRQLTYVAAGHHAYLLDARGEIKQMLRSEALPIHVRPDGSYAASPPLAIEPGDLLLQFTDGVTESTSPDGQALGSERLLDVVRAHRDKPARNIVEMVFHAVQDILQGRQPSDDATVVLAKFD